MSILLCGFDETSYTLDGLSLNYVVVVGLFFFCFYVVLGLNILLTKLDESVTAVVLVCFCFSGSFCGRRDWLFLEMIAS